MEPIVKNVMECRACGDGVVDRFEHCFQCRDCGALGDLVTGIMTPNPTLNADVPSRGACKKAASAAPVTAG